MSHPLNLQRGFSLPEVLVAMVLMVMIVTALSGYQRVLMHSFALRHQYLQIWRQAWQEVPARVRCHRQFPSECLTY